MDDQVLEGECLTLMRSNKANVTPVLNRQYNIDLQQKVAVLPRSFKEDD